jgi:hypothetical protein
MTPYGWPEPVPTANAVSSMRSFASASSSGSCCAMSESDSTSKEPNRYASAFCGVIFSWPTVGVASAASTPSAVHSALTPAEVTPFQSFVAVVLIVATCR